MFSVLLGPDCDLVDGEGCRTRDRLAGRYSRRADWELEIQSVVRIVEFISQHTFSFT